MNRVRLNLGLGLTLAAWSGASCKKASEENTAPAAEDQAAHATSGDKQTAAHTPAAIELPPGDGPVARVNGVDIPRKVFNREYRQTMERYQRARHDVKPALRERLKDNIVQRLVDAEVIRQQAKKLEISVPEEEMTDLWDKHKKRYGSQEAFAAFLDRAGTTQEDVKRTFEVNILRERVFGEVSKSVKIDGSEARTFYKKNEKRYQEPEQVRASHILFRIPAGSAPETAQKKEKTAQTVLARAKKGDAFEKLAQEFGEDPTKTRGGDLGFFTRGRMVKPFEDAVWKLKKGQLSGLVKTQFGIHIIKKTDHRPARKKKFSEVSDQIERSLLARKRNQAIRKSLDEWKKAAEIEVFVKGDASVIAAGQPRSIAPGVIKNRPVPKDQKPSKLDVKLQPSVQDTRDSTTN